MVALSRLSISLLLSITIALRGYSKKSLDLSGALSAVCVGFLTCFCGYRFAAVLILFFLSSSFFTKLKNKQKQEYVLESKKEGSERNWIQVLCNSFMATVVAMYYFSMQNYTEIYFDFDTFYNETCCLAFILGHYACCCGDTWASEIGILSSSEPRLITTFKKVRRGTNGGVSPLGLGASVAGGTFIGFVFYFSTLFFADSNSSVSPPQWPLIFLGTLGGFFGSLIDSLLGATVQYSGYSPILKKVVNRPMASAHRISGADILDNNQ